jgi:lysophospholipase L1-like esterase
MSGAGAATSGGRWALAGFFVCVAAGAVPQAHAQTTFPVWPSGCSRFEGAERAACLLSIANDYGTLARYASANAALKPPLPRERRVVFFGDSITDNWDAEGFGGFFPGKPYVNRGIGGQTTGQMLLRFRQDVLDLDPAVVVILAGTNDVGGNAGPASDATIQDNLRSMAELASFNGIQVVLSSILPVSDGKKRADGTPYVWTDGRPNARLKGLNEWLKAYTNANAFTYLDYATPMTAADGTLKSDLTDDGLHPNAAGYAVMNPLVEAAIAKALEPPPSIRRSPVPPVPPTPPSPPARP